MFRPQRRSRLERSDCVQRHNVCLSCKKLNVLTWQRNTFLVHVSVDQRWCPFLRPLDKAKQICLVVLEYERTILRLYWFMNAVRIPRVPTCHFMTGGGDSALYSMKQNKSGPSSSTGKNHINVIYRGWASVLLSTHLYMATTHTVGVQKRGRWKTAIAERIFARKIRIPPGIPVRLGVMNR